MQNAITKVKTVLLIPAFLRVMHGLFAQKMVFNINDSGAKGDSLTYNTMAIQKAIDNAALSGNGKVIVPAGKYLIGVIHLKLHVEL